VVPARSRLPRDVLGRRHDLLDRLRRPTCTGGHGKFRATWSLGHGQLRFRNVLAATDPGDEIYWTRKPWQKIG
jgi:hypothetical protein